MKNTMTVKISLPMLPLVVILAILKLTKVANIGWGIVFMPIWAPLLLFIAVMLIGIAVIVLKAFFGSKKRKKK